MLRHFREEVEAHLRDRKCPSGVCFNDRKVAAALAAAGGAVAAAPRSVGNGNGRA